MRCAPKEVTRISVILTLWSYFSLTYAASIPNPLKTITGGVVDLVKDVDDGIKKIATGFVRKPPRARGNHACNIPVPQSSYDYIIVGSGAGGGPLSARLAQAGFSVLLIEAGDDHGDDFVVQIPLLQTQASEYIAQSWEYFVSHYDDQKQAEQDSKFTWRTPPPQSTLHVGPNPPLGSQPLGIYYPRASTLGGCTEHNALVAMYPHESDWNNIASITGDSSWDASNMRQFWQKLEHNEYPLTPATSAGHGFGGWLDTSLTDLNLVANDSQWLSLAQGTIVAVGKGTPNGLPTTASQLSQSFIFDLNNDSPARDTTAGIYQIPLSITSSSKSRSSPRNFILNTANAKNPDGSRKYHLDIQLNTLATRVTFDKSKPPRATGVEYMTGCHIYAADPLSKGSKPSGKRSVKANKEVILSAGTFNTPQLLKLSGVGPQAELAELGIPVVLNAPAVGTNMQDRYEVTITASAPANFSSLATCTFLHSPGVNGEVPTADPCFNTWNNTEDPGIYGTNGVAFGIVDSSSVAASTEADLFIAGLPFDFHGYFPGYSTASDLKHWAWLVLKAHTRNNAGTVTLKSNNPLDMPQISFRSFSDADSDLDVTAVAEGVKIARSLFSNVPASSNISFTEELPGTSIPDDSDALKSWIKQEAWGHHASCTVPIGKLGDQNAVLDSNFKVQGIDGLRVVDASVFPKIPGFYIAGAIYMISEKAASVIIADAASSK